MNAVGPRSAGATCAGGPSNSALYLLRLLQTFEDKKRSTLDAMAYSAGVGLTAHLDQVLFPTPGPLSPTQVLSNLEFGSRDLRWMVHHVPFVTTDLLDCLQAVGGAVQMAAYRWVTSGSGDSGVGAPFRTIVDHGIQAGIHGDGVHIAPLSPWPHIYYATTGLNSFGVQVNAGQQLARQEALRIFTRQNSWFLRMEDEIGSIEEGELADLVVLDRDYFAVPDEDIKRIRSVLTVVGGAVVHDSVEI